MPRMKINDTHFILILEQGETKRSVGRRLYE